VKTKVKVGDLVKVKVHIANSRNPSGKVLLSEPQVGIVISRLNGDGYYDVALNSGKMIFTSYANLDVINKDRSEEHGI
jgi:hypothetical protein